MHFISENGATPRSRAALERIRGPPRASDPRDEAREHPVMQERRPPPRRGKGWLRASDRGYQDARRYAGGGLLRAPCPAARRYASGCPHRSRVSWSGSGAMAEFPRRLLATIRAAPPRATTHATEEIDRLALGWLDLMAVAETAEWWQSNRDEARPSKYKHEMIGRDTHGRRLYTAGKEIEHRGEKAWLVITIHEADG